MAAQSSTKGEQRRELLDAEVANALHEHLYMSEYASLDHVMLAIRWYTGMRIGALRAIELNDLFPYGAVAIEVHHHPES